MGILRYAYRAWCDRDLSMTSRFAEFISREQLHGRRALECFTLLAAAGLWVLLGTLDLVSAQPPPSPTGESATETTQEARDGAPSSYRVLLLYSEARLTPSVVRMDQALRSTLEARSPRPVYFYTEFLDLNSFRGAALQDELVKLPRVKYRQRPIDLIVAQGQLTVPFVLQNRADLFSSPRSSSSRWSPRPSPISRPTPPLPARGGREAGERLSSLPGASIPGHGERWSSWAHRRRSGCGRIAARQQLAAHAGSIEITYLVGSSSETVLKTIAASPGTRSCSRARSCAMGPDAISP